tara:strand:+ start:748 stop:918 length:171 start_codon:yes stop_codon:yes gene_type:complete
MTKIVLVHWKGGIPRWYPYSLETLEELANSCCAIDMIEIIDCGIEGPHIVVDGENK